MLIDTGTVQIHVREAGSGAPLLLLHGLGMSGALWHAQFAAFAPRYRTLAPDLRGFGHSSRPHAPGAYAIDRLAADVLEVIERLAIRGCHLLGTSMGGFVAQSVAVADAGACRSLILCHTAACMSIPDAVMRARLDALATQPFQHYARMVAEQACAPHASAELRAWVADMIARNDPRAYLQVLTEGLRDFDLRDRLPGLRLPTLVITGEHDRVLPPAGGAELAGLIPAARLVQLAGVGHLGYVEDAPAFNAALADFLDTL